jgi:hypothetical protein
MTRLQESRTVEISVYGLTRGVGLTTHSYSILVIRRFGEFYLFRRHARFLAVER